MNNLLVIFYECIYLYMRACVYMRVIYLQIISKHSVIIIIVIILIVIIITMVIIVVVIIIITVGWRFVYILNMFKREKFHYSVLSYTSLLKYIYLIPTNSSAVMVCSFGTFSVSDYLTKLLHICKPKMCQHY